MPESTPRSAPVIAIVAPRLKEQECLDRTPAALKDVLEFMRSHGDIDEQSFIDVVDDGSSDATRHQIETAHGRRALRGTPGRMSLPC